MAYGVYYRQAGSKGNFIRVGEWVKSSRSKTGERFIPTRYVNMADAVKKCDELIARGYDTKISIKL